MNQSEISARDRFRPENMEANEVSIIVGALNGYGFDLGTVATEDNLTAFTWEQVLHALLQSRVDCFGDARDDVDDVIYLVQLERKSYVH